MSQTANTARITRQAERFLIVEDSKFDQERITRVLNRNFRNAEIYYASTLQAARDFLEANTVSMILLDNNLPDGRGANYVLELAQDDELSRIPVIIVSDWPSPFMWHKAKTAGVLFVLKKDEFHAGYVQFALLKTRRENRDMTPPISIPMPTAVAPTLSEHGPNL